jgi:hypothetical protein
MCDLVETESEDGVFYCNTCGEFVEEPCGEGYENDH